MSQKPLPPLSATALQLQKGVYEHYSSLLVEVMGVTRHSEDLSEFVLYRKIDTGTLWIRPLEMFLETVEIEGKRMPRFRFVGSHRSGEYVNNQ